MHKAPVAKKDDKRGVHLCGTGLYGTHPTRNWNANVKRERAVADRNQMAVSRGKNPTAKGGLGAVLGLAREAPDGCGITEIAVCVVDGKRYLVYYDVNGNEVLI